MDNSNPRSSSVDVENLLSNMGIQQVVSEKSVAKNRSKRKQQIRKKDHSMRQSKSSFPGVSLQTQLDYTRNGHAILRNFIVKQGDTHAQKNRLSSIRKQVTDHIKDEELKAWVQKVQVAAGNDIASSCTSISDCQQALLDVGVTSSLPFLQYFNTWRKISVIKDLAMDLGKTASVLMDVPTVRLYQDAVFWKRSQDGPTPWHADARMAPFDTSHMVTFWIPLQAVPSPEDGGTALVFCSKSHSDFALPYWNPSPAAEKNDECNNSVPSGWDRLEDRYPKRLVDYMPMSLGDVSVHSGWTLHCSNGNEASKDRIALAITFVDGDAEIRPDWETVGDDEDRWSYQEWCKETTPLSRISHDLVPIVWPPSLRNI